MAFLPRLPTFTTELVWYQYDPVGGTWEEQSPITGQVYTPQRSQDDDSGGLLYFMYPKESDLLHDTYDYGSDGNADVIAITYPTGALFPRYYRVREILPRWFGFPNEHLMATLQRLTNEEISDVLSGDFFVDSIWMELTDGGDHPPADWNISVTNPFPSEWTAEISDLVSPILFFDSFLAALPPTAEITGLELYLKVWNKDGTSLDAFEFGQVQLYRPTSMELSENKDFEHPEGFTTTEVERVYGGPTDLWGIDWVRTDLGSDNNIQLQLRINAAVSGVVPVTVRVTQTRLRVYYSL